MADFINQLNSTNEMTFTKGQHSQFVMVTVAAVLSLVAAVVVLLVLVVVEVVVVVVVDSVVRMVVHVFAVTVEV